MFGKCSENVRNGSSILRLSSEKCRNLEINMAGEVDKRALLEGTQPNTPPYSPNNEYDQALFHEKGKSPKEVRISHVLCPGDCGDRM